MPANDKSTPKSHRGVVLDPQWEVALRAGQQAEDDQGSVEDELAVVHLLRHARAPQAIDEDALDSLWGDLDAALEEERAQTGWRAWLRRPWVLAGGLGTAAAAAAVLVMVWAPTTEDPSAPSTPQVAQVQESERGKADMAATIEAQFAMLEPGARNQVRRSVEDGRTQLRGELLASALRADGRTMGGAP